MADHSADPLAPESLFGHVEDSLSFHGPFGLHWDIPQPFEPYFTFTKFMLLEVLAAALIALFFITLAKRIHGGVPPKGRFWNMLEVFLLYFRDYVARPCIGRKDGDRFVPFLWTMFFFVLGCNLLGMVPWMGSPTASLSVTGALALVTFAVVIGTGVSRFGVTGFLKAQVPHMDLPKPVAVVLIPIIFVIEIFGMLIKHGVLAVRLLANMMAGHVVLAVIVAFIGATAASMMWFAIAPISILAATALSMLELFVAFLQAFIFTFLSALFIGMAVHPH